MKISYTFLGSNPVFKCNVCAMKGDTTYLVGVFIRYSNRLQIIFLLFTAFLTYIFMYMLQNTEEEAQIKTLNKLLFNSCQENYTIMLTIISVWRNIWSKMTKIYVELRQCKYDFAKHRLQIIVYQSLIFQATSVII